MEFYVTLPFIYLYGAQTSNSFVPSAFKTQWYRNMSLDTQVWFLDEQLYKSALTSHSYEFLGQCSTYWIDWIDDMQGIVLTPFKIWEKINKEVSAWKHWQYTTEKNIGFQFIQYHLDIINSNDLIYRYLLLDIVIFEHLTLY